MQTTRRDDTTEPATGSTTMRAIVQDEYGVVRSEDGFGRSPA